MVYWMVFGQPKQVEEFIKIWAEKYKNKFGIMPDRCYINPSWAEIEKKIDQIFIIRDKYVPKFEFWFSRSNAKC